MWKSQIVNKRPYLKSTIPRWHTLEPLLYRQAYYSRTHRKDKIWWIKPRDLTSVADKKRECFKIGGWCCRDDLWSNIHPTTTPAFNAIDCFLAGQSGALPNAMLIWSSCAIVKSIMDFFLSKRKYHFWCSPPKITTSYLRTSALVLLL